MSSASPTRAISRDAHFHSLVSFYGLDMTMTMVVQVSAT